MQSELQEELSDTHKFLCMSPVIVIRFRRNVTLSSLYLFCTNTVDYARPRNNNTSDSSTYCVLYLASSGNPSMCNFTSERAVTKARCVCVCFVCVCVCGVCVYVCVGVCVCV
jgi:hypothetical protein